MQSIIKVLALLAIPLGGAFVYGGVQSIGDSITPFPVPKDEGELVVDGAYAYLTLTPMNVVCLVVVGLILMGFGLALITGDESRFAAAALLAAVLNLKVCSVQQASGLRYELVCPATLQ